MFGAGFAQPVRDLDAEQRPFEIFTSATQLADYRSSHEGDFFNLTDEQYALYDEAFFAGNALMLVLTQGMSGSIRCIAEGHTLDGSSLYLTVRELSPSMHTMDLHYNTLGVTLTPQEASAVKAVYIRSYRVDV